VTKNASGISIKTQELYLLVFVTRYLDLFTTFYSVRYSFLLECKWKLTILITQVYNSLMKVLYISATAYIVYMVRKIGACDSLCHFGVVVILRCRTLQEHVRPCTRLFSALAVRGSTMCCTRYNNQFNPGI
jgi:hypothetical protein